MIRGLILAQGSSFATGVEVQDRRKRVLMLSTGSKSVDAILGGTKSIPPKLRNSSCLQQAELCLSQ